MINHTLVRVLAPKCCFLPLNILHFCVESAEEIEIVLKAACIILHNLQNAATFILFPVIMHVCSLIIATVIISVKFTKKKQIKKLFSFHAVYRETDKEIAIIVDKANKLFKIL